MSWMHTVAGWPLGLSVGIIAVFSGIVSWGLVHLVRRRRLHQTFKENNELVGFSYAVVGLIYGVFLAFIIITAWERFADAEKIVQHETVVLNELWRDVEVFPAEARGGMHADLIAYVRSVLDEEWPEMGARGRSHPATVQIYERLWRRASGLQPETKNQEAFLAEVLGNLNLLTADRRLRILYSRSEINVILWLVLLAGAVPTVGLSLLLANKDDWVHILVTASLMLIVLLSLYVALALQYPFTGDAAIGPVAFRDLLDNIHLRFLRMIFLP